MVWFPHLTHAQTMEVRDLAALVWWECLAAAGDDGGEAGRLAGFAEAARTAASAPLHPEQR
ncbi:hypothetical protein POF50_008480 [Streptomyces sp. SL13]|uniref:Uncharacterized protein n=1 Tax=Streptantibioticus silvisoli TaxID=2705255 RepID=A0AA90H7H6_9ACTN|nr:hypothetical protein [Streptantibioticus silvisoli]MDI5969382.1 hypothetical protein [Streptantibioticus silvisoli]